MAVCSAGCSPCTFRCVVEQFAQQDLDVQPAPEPRLGLSPDAPASAAAASSPRGKGKLGRGEYRPPASAWPDRDTLRVASAEPSHAGEWECTVTQRALNLTWTTAWLRVNVLPAPSFVSHLMEDDATRWLFGWTGSELGAQLLGAAIALLSVAACCTAYYLVTRVYRHRAVVKK